MVILGIMLLANEEAYSQRKHRHEIFLSKEEYILSIEPNGSMKTMILNDSVIKLLLSQENFRLHLVDNTGKAILAAGINIYESAMPSGCNYYFIYEWVSSNGEFVLERIPTMNKHRLKYSNKRKARVQ